jgi:hypothetical protein
MKKSLFFRISEGCLLILIILLSVSLATSISKGCSPVEQQSGQFLPALHPDSFKFAGVDTSEALVHVYACKDCQPVGMKALTLYNRYDYRGPGYPGFKTASRWVYLKSLDSTGKEIKDSVHILKTLEQ